MRPTYLAILICFQGERSNISETTQSKSSFNKSAPCPRRLCCAWKRVQSKTNVFFINTQAYRGATQCAKSNGWGFFPLLFFLFFYKTKQILGGKKGLITNKKGTSRNWIRQKLEEYPPHKSAGTVSCWKLMNMHLSEESASLMLSRGSLPTGIWSVSCR